MYSCESRKRLSCHSVLKIAVRVCVQYKEVRKKIWLYPLRFWRLLPEKWVKDIRLYDVTLWLEQKIDSWCFLKLKRIHGKLLSNRLVSRICPWNKNEFQEQMLPSDADSLGSCPQLKIWTEAVFRRSVNGAELSRWKPTRRLRSVSDLYAWFAWENDVDDFYCMGEIKIRLFYSMLWHRMLWEKNKENLNVEHFFQSFHST